MFGEIGPGTVVGDNFAAGVRFHLRLPLFVGLFEAFFKGFVAFGEIVGVGRTHFAELVLDSFSDAQAVIGIEPIMRIAEGMDIPFGASNLAGGQLQNSGEARSVEIAGAAYLNAGVAGLSDRRRKPHDLEFATDEDKELEKKFVGVGKSVGRSGETPKAILTTNLAEFAGPIGDDAGETGIGEASVARVPAAIEAASNCPAAIDAIFGEGIKAEGVLGVEQRGLEHGELIAGAPEEFGAEEEGVVDGAAKRLP